METSKEKQEIIDLKDLNKLSVQNEKYSQYMNIIDKIMNNIELLEMIRPHMNAKGRAHIDKALNVYDRVNRLKGISIEDRGIIDYIENMIEIVEMFNFNKKYQVKKTLKTAKDVMKSVKR